MRFPTMSYVPPAKAQTSLRICAVWSEPLQVAWIFYDCWATEWTTFWISKLKKRLHRLVWVYTCQKATLLEITCQGSILIWCLVVSYVPPNWMEGTYEFWCSSRWHLLSFLPALFEPVVWFWPNLETLLGRGKELIRFWWPLPSFQGHNSTLKCQIFTKMLFPHVISCQQGIMDSGQT